jgi:hypothetical protein
MLWFSNANEMRSLLDVLELNSLQMLWINQQNIKSNNISNIFWLTYAMKKLKPYCEVKILKVFIHSYSENRVLNETLDEV